MITDSFLSLLVFSLFLQVQHFTWRKRKGARSCGAAFQQQPVSWASQMLTSSWATAASTSGIMASVMIVDNIRLQGEVLLLCFPACITGSCKRKQMFLGSRQKKKKRKHEYLRYVLIKKMAGEKYRLTRDSRCCGGNDTHTIRVV